MALNFNGKPLKPKHEEALVEATKIHNQFQKNRNPEYVEITPLQYLEDLMERQLDGIIQGVGAQKELEEAHQRKIEEARKRIGLVQNARIA